MREEKYEKEVKKRLSPTGGRRQNGLGYFLSCLKKKGSAADQCSARRREQTRGSSDTRRAEEVVIRRTVNKKPHRQRTPATAARTPRGARLGQVILKPPTSYDPKKTRRRRLLRSSVAKPRGLHLLLSGR